MFKSIDGGWEPPRLIEELGGLEVAEMCVDLCCSEVGHGLEKRHSDFHPDASSALQQALLCLWQAFGLTVKQRAKGVVDHPAWTFLIDREGMVRYRYLGSLLDVEIMLEDMRTLW